MSRRILYRTLAVAAALAAISPLFAAGSSGCTRGSTQNKPAQISEHRPHWPQVPL